MKIKTGDTVKVIAGKDKGKTGQVLKVHRDIDQVSIEGVNIAKKHQKNRRTGSVGQIVELTKPVHVSNVALMDGDKTVRVGYKVEGDKKTRVARPTGKTI
jgi:large subunit ribosomal protein L24